MNEQLHAAHSFTNSLVSSLDGYKSTIERLEQRVRTTEDALMHSVNMFRRRCDNLEEAAEAARSAELR